MGIMLWPKQMFNTPKLLYLSFFKDTSIQEGLQKIQPSESKLVVKTTRKDQG